MVCFIFSSFIIISFSLIAFCDERISGQLIMNVKKAPKDYAYSPNGSRVRDLAQYFESMNKNIAGEDTQSQNVIITLSEAASKLRLLSFGYTLDTKCNKYVKLFNQPNIRSFATINLLVREDKAFSDTQQTDANLVSKLLNERNFDALSKLQTILQVIESERSGSRSVFELDVQKDLLDCMSYYIYRHQKATSGIIDYVRTCREQVSPLVANPTEFESELRKLTEQIKKIKHLESFGDTTINGRNSTSVWLEELSKLHNLLKSNEAELPSLVIDFVTNTKRLDRLKSLEPDVNIAPTTTQVAFNLEFNSPEDYLNEENKFFSSLKNGRSETGTEASKQNSGMKKDDALTYEEVAPIENNSESFSDSLPEITQQVSDKIRGDLSLSRTLKDEEDDLSSQTVHTTESAIEDVNTQSTSAANLESKASASSSNENSDVRCERFLLEFNGYLRSLNWNYLELSKARLIARRLQQFKMNCLNNQRGSDWEYGSSIWPFISMTRKLTTWSLNELKDLSKTQQTLLNVLELVH